MNKKIITCITVGILVLAGAITLLIYKSTAKPEYEITFNTEEGNVLSSLKVDKNGKVIKPVDPTKEGYIFEGWYYNGEPFDFDTKITKDIVLEARWIPQKEEKIELSNTNLSLVLGNEEKLDIISLPKGINETDLIYESSDETIATVDSKGNIKALATGIITITIKTKDNAYIATSTVYVTKNSVSVDSVAITGASEVSVGSSIKLTAEINPANATNKDVVWSSSDKSIAKIDSNGKVTGVKSGTVTITVTTNDGNKKATKKITITQKTTTTKTTTTTTTTTKKTTTTTKKDTAATVKVSGITINGGDRNMNVGDNITLTATISPSNATNKNFTWSSSDSSIVSVDKNGKIEAKSAGTATITATTEDGNKTNSIKVTVKSVYTITLTKMLMEDGKSYSQYEIKVYKDGKTTTDFKYVIFGSSPVGPNEKTVSSSIADGVTSVTILLSDNSTQTAKVTIN